MFMKSQSNIDYIKILIFLSFCISLIVSKYNLNNYDRYSEKDGIALYHIMIKSDANRYLSHGAEIKKDLENGKNFFETGREHFTKYLPPRLAAAYYYFLDIDLFNNIEEKKINLGIHFPYLILQCLFYYMSLFFLYLVISKKIEKKICFPIVIFLALEPTIFQYHGTFWSESFFFTLQIILLILILRDNLNFFNFFFIGIFLSLLSLQKQVAYFYIFPIFFYYLLYLKKNEYYKLLFILFGFFLIQMLPGYNNFVRSGKFYLLTADTKTAVYYNIVEPIVTKNNDLTNKEFKIAEGKVALEWLQTNSIKFDSKKINIEESRYPFVDYRNSIVNESDKIRYDKFFVKRTIKLLLDNPWTSFKYILNKSLHVALLNPFHIYSDHKFGRGEFYYTTDTHDKLVPVRVFYSILIYAISLVGFINLIKAREYKLLTIIMLSMLYFYAMVSWHGNTRYFVPVLIYISFLFGYGCDNLLRFTKKINR